MSIPEHRSVALMLSLAGLLSAMHGARAAPPEAESGPAIYVSEFEVMDAEAMRPYSAKVEATFTQFGGHYVVRGGNVVSLEGDPSKRIVMIEFPNMERAQAWYGSPEYSVLKPIRHQAARSRVYIVQTISR